MAESVFVQDGYYFQGEIPGLPGLYPAVSFEFRPCTTPERRAYIEAGRVNPDKANADLILSHTKSWAIKVSANKPPEPLALNEAVIAKLHANIVEEFLNFAVGYRGGRALEQAEKNSSSASASS